MRDVYGNVVRKKHYNQVCVWPGGLCPMREVEDAIRYGLKIRVQCLEYIVTYPDLENGKPVPGTGGRFDLFFAVHHKDVQRFAIPRFDLGIRWIEDVLWSVNYHSPIYPERVFRYRTWKP